MYRCSIPDLLSFIEGYKRRLRHSWEQSRLLNYSIYALTTPEERREQIEDWMPLWFDPSPEERRNMNEVSKIKQGMVAEKDIERYRSYGINI